MRDVLRLVAAVSKPLRKKRPGRFAELAALALFPAPEQRLRSRACVCLWLAGFAPDRAWRAALSPDTSWMEYLRAAVEGTDDRVLERAVFERRLSVAVAAERRAVLGNDRDVRSPDLS